MKKFMKTAAVWFALIAVVFCTCSDDSGSGNNQSGNNQPGNNQPDYIMTGTYTFSNTGGSCTWVFTADGKYQCTGYGFVGTKTGTWSAKGNDVTISYATSDGGSISGNEVFTVQESGNQLTLTLKDGQISNLLVIFSLAAKSVTLTKSSGSGDNGGGNIAVTFSGVTANGSVSQTTTQLAFTFSQAITGLSADDITLNGVSGVTKGTLNGSGPTYTLGISGFTTGGSLRVAVAKAGYTISDSSKTVTIYYFPEVTLSNVTANGSASQTTTQLTFTFSQAFSYYDYLNVSDITLSGISGVTKGTISGSGATYTLSISGFTTGGSLNVAVTKTGYTISGSPQTVTIYYFSNIPISPTGIEMVSIPAGTFTMGSPETEPNRGSYETQHSVTLSGFYMGKYQVTQEQYQAVMGTNPSNFKSVVTGESGTPGKLPVEMVNWYDAIVFCNKLSIKEGLSPVYSISGSTNPAVWGTVPTDESSPTVITTWSAVVMDKSKNGYRLPTEAEWEYACRAGTTTAFNNGNDDYTNTASVGAVAWYDGNSGNKTHQVGLKTANAWGLYDMHGNVGEWCWDWYDDYPSSSLNNPTGPVEIVYPYRVLRGGSCGSYGYSLRSACRNAKYPPDRYRDLGFRLVRSGS
jgi:formylglycine-generating enzyme